MKRLLALTALIFAGCDAQAITHAVIGTKHLENRKYAVGDKVMLKQGISGVITKLTIHDRYYVRMLFTNKAGGQELRSMIINEAEIEKKVR